eukprot:1059222-Rhodomonas_salina.1
MQLSVCSTDPFRALAVAAPGVIAHQFCFWTDTSTRLGDNAGSEKRCGRNTLAGVASAAQRPAPRPSSRTALGNSTSESRHLNLDAPEMSQREQSLKLAREIARQHPAEHCGRGADPSRPQTRIRPSTVDLELFGIVYPRKRRPG